MIDESKLIKASEKLAKIEANYRKLAAPIEEEIRKVVEENATNIEALEDIFDYLNEGGYTGIETFYILRRIRGLKEGKSL